VAVNWPSSTLGPRCSTSHAVMRSRRNAGLGIGAIYFRSLSSRVPMRTSVRHPAGEAQATAQSASLRGILKTRCRRELRVGCGSPECQIVSHNGDPV
jgi:hypothetical protein